MTSSPIAARRLSRPSPSPTTVDVDDNRQLEGPLAENGVVLVHGVEISTLYGDFIVYSPDLDYLADFNDVRRYPPPAEIPDRRRARLGASGRRRRPQRVDVLLGPAPTWSRRIVDAVEVWNGNWSGARYVQAAEQHRA